MMDAVRFRSTLWGCGFLIHQARPPHLLPTTPQHHHRLGTISITYLQVSRHTPARNEPLSSSARCSCERHRYARHSTLPHQPLRWIQRQQIPRQASYTQLQNCILVLIVRDQTAKQHARTVASKLGVGRGLIFLVGKPTVFLDDSDQAVPFRQRRYFYYLSGANEPDCYLTYDIAKDHLTLYVPDFDLRQTVWMGPTISIGEALDR